MRQIYAFAVTMLVFATPAVASDFCPVTITGSLTGGDPQQTGRINRFTPGGTCALPEACPGLFTATGSRAYDLYGFHNTNTQNPACVSVNVNTPCTGTQFIFVIAYLGTVFDPLNLCANYLADTGGSPNPTGFMSFNVAPAADFTILVHEVTPAAGCASYTLDVTGCDGNNGDFNADTKTDILFRHAISGKNVAWFMDGITRTAGVFTNPDQLPDTNWQMAGTNDFNADNKADIIFRHQVSGKNVVWYMDGVTRTAGVFTNPDTLADTNWRVVGTGDFSSPNDGKTDLLFRHAITGKNVVWFMDGITRTAGVFTNPDQLADTNWFMVGIGDFWSVGGGQDNKSDILWRHNFSGKNVLWYMDGITRTAGVFTNPDQLPDTYWRMSAVGDYSTPLDGKPDILFRHGISGKNVVWYMDGATRTGGVFTNPDQLPDTNWRIVGPR